MARGYDKSFIREQIRTARRITRNEALYTPALDRKKTNRTPLVLTYYPGLPNTGVYFAIFIFYCICLTGARRRLKNIP